MRHCLTILFAALLLSANLGATTCLPPTGYPGATMLGTFDATSTVASGVSSRQFETSGSGTECKVTWTTCVWRTGGGSILYAIDPLSVAFTGDCTDTLPTTALFALMMQESLGKGIGLGYSPCPSSCANPIITRVYTVSCVLRTGSGSSTSFTPCSTGQSYREYSYCCAGGVPVITELPVASDGCTAPCESTTDGSGSVLQ
jgi:hypothetical protein